MSAATIEQNNQTCSEHAKAFYDSTLESFNITVDTMLTRQLINSATNLTSIEEALKYEKSFKTEKKYANIKILIIFF
jgi:hypothetical protein